MEALDSLDEPLTVLGDRTAFCHAVRRRLAEWKRGGPTVSLVLLEINAFDQIVEQHGENCGRLLVNKVGNAILAVVREMDFVASYGPGSFGLLQAGVSQAELLSLAKRLHQAVAECGLSPEDVVKGLTASSGTAAANEGDDFIGLLRRAEEALHAAKEDDSEYSYYHNGRWPEPAHDVQEVSSS